MKNMRIHSVLTLLALTLSMGLHAAPQTVKLTERFCEPTRLLVGCQVLDATGTYSVEVTPDSIVEVDLQIGVPETKVEASIKKGETFLFGCEKFDKEGVYPVTFQSSWGCDSVVNLHLSFIACDTARSENLFTLCEKELPYTYEDALARKYLINKDTTFVAVFPDMAASGCDSIAKISFVVNRMVLDSLENKTICSGDYIVWRGQVCDQAKSYFDTVRYVASGCDSAYYQLDLKLADVVSSEQTRLACGSEVPFIYQGTHAGAKKYIVQGDTTIHDTIAAGSASGCDSVAITHIIVHRLMLDSADKKTICRGSSFEWRGQVCNEAKTYFDTVRYAKSGCDSAYYSLKVSFFPEVKISKQQNLCASDIPYRYQGYKLYIINQDTVINDTVFGGAATGCDSVAVITFRVLPEPKAEIAFTLCEKELPYTYQGKHAQSKKFIITDDIVFNDTVPASNGCDSVTTITVQVMRVVATDVLDTTICQGAQVLWRNHFYTEAKTYVEKEQYKLSGCDSAVHTLTIRFFKAATLPNIVDFVGQMGEVVCDRVIDASAMKQAIEEDVQLKNQVQGVAKIASWWLEVNFGAAWAKLQATDKPHGRQSFQLRIAAQTACGDQLTGNPFTFSVLVPAPENTPAYDNLPAVSKYNSWLLMLNLNQIHKDLPEIEFDEEDVSWYIVNGELDNTQTGVKDDGLVGTGYYYTADRSLSGQYYAIIHANDDNCGAILRTIRLTCQAKAAMSLAPRRIHAGEVMTLSNLDPEQSTSLTVYTADGKTLRHKTVMGVESYDMQPNDNDGVYLLRVVNGDQTETFKYILTK